MNALNKKNYNNLASKDNIDILDYKASFVSNNEIALLDHAGNVKDKITGNKIVINTGAQANIPKIEGIKTTKNISYNIFKYICDISVGNQPLSEEKIKLIRKLKKDMNKHNVENKTIGHVNKS